MHTIVTSEGRVSSTAYIISSRPLRKQITFVPVCFVPWQRSILLNMSVGGCGGGDGVKCGNHDDDVMTSTAILMHSALLIIL